MALLRLIRFPNLIVVALTQWLVAQRILGEAYRQQGIQPALQPEELWLLIFATASLVATGYVINDLLDYRIDMINRPERVIVGKRISTGTVGWIAACFVFVGFGLSLLLAFQKEELELLWLYPVFGILLAWYPRHLKTKPFLGNLFIAICCAGAAGLIWLAERNAYLQLTAETSRKVSYILTLFMGYAFLATWIREIIKDFEDQEGDIQLGRITLPIYLGKKRARQLVVGLTILLAITLSSGAIPGRNFPAQASVITASVLLILVLIYLTVRFLRATQAAHYHQLSQFWKFFLLGGLLLLYLYPI